MWVVYNIILQLSFRIVPQAICTRYGLAIGYYFAPLVWILIALFFPLGFPIAIVLDKILGKDHNTFFRRAGIGKCSSLFSTIVEIVYIRIYMYIAEPFRTMKVVGTNIYSITYFLGSTDFTILNKFVFSIPISPASYMYIIILVLREQKTSSKI